MWPEKADGKGYYWCRRCQKHGDNIQFLRDFEGLSYQEACARLGIELKGRPAVHVPRAPKLPRQYHQEFRPAVRDLPTEAWLAKAEEFAAACHQHLMQDRKALAWLASRGINRETARKYCLGFNPGNHGKPLYKSRKAWDLPLVKNSAGKVKPLWLPPGLVIPLIDSDNRVVQLRIRRTEADRKELLPELKYYVVPGSSQATMVLNPVAKAFVVVEAGLDAMLVVQEASGLEVGALTTWNATAKPDAYATGLLRHALRILVALDNDAAGEAASSWWTKHFRSAKRWPVPKGKDPGEAFQAGVDIRAWVLAGLPPAMTMFVSPPNPAGDEGMDPGLQDRDGGGGRSCKECPRYEEVAGVPGCVKPAVEGEWREEWRPLDAARDACLEVVV